MNRRQFLQATGVAAAASLVGASGSWAADEAKKVWIVAGPGDAVLSSAAGKWAVAQFREALEARGVAVVEGAKVEAAAAGSRCVMIFEGEPLKPDLAESIGFANSEANGRPLLLVDADGQRGLVYTLTELADRVRHADDPLAALDVPEPVIEHPANRVRGILRPFASDVEDKPWFNDEGFWRRYLTMLATERFNRFHLALGLGYDFTREIKDAYFHFAYPFFVAVPGYDVRATNLPDAERDRNLRMLKFASDEAANRGLHFQLGLWTHAYEWTESPDANHRIEGLTREKHANYCRDALRTILRACPGIAGVTIRIHGESGIAEGSYDFWRTVFDGAKTCGRTVEIDMHAKGIDDDIINVALATGLRVTVSPKSWAEHMGLPYHQAWIRPNELPRQEKGEGLFAQSGGARRFLRYGYGDLLKEDRRYGVIHRTWPGTQRLLMWGDPETAAAYGRFAGFCGSDGIELFEPLSFKGKKGSGLPGGRDGYADASLKTADDFEKHRYGYRVWGRLLYNPDAKPDAWRRMLKKDFGPAAEHVERALASASRILPLITTAHCPSAANNNYWPELYANMSMVEEAEQRPYRDTPEPRRFGTVSPLDPQLFSTMDEHAAELLAGAASGKYSPAEVARWLDALADASAKHLTDAERAARDANDPAFRRMAIDVAIQSGIGRFFAHKFRAGVLYAMYRQIGDSAALERSVQCYRAARDAWAALAERAKGVYVTDVSFGHEPQQRGHWLDRLRAIDDDIAAVEKQSKRPTTRGTTAAPIAGAIAAVLNPPARPSANGTFAPTPPFRRGQPVTIELAFAGDASTAVHFHYRRVNQAEAWRSELMRREGDRYRVTIPAAYADSPYPLQYYGELRHPSGVQLHPGLGETLMNQPYVVVRQETR